MADDDSLQGRMRRLTERAVDEADVCLFSSSTPARGVTAADEYFADILRKRAPRHPFAANKAEGRAGETGALEAYALGLGEPLRISAEHGEGMDDLYRALLPLAEEFEAANNQQAPETDVAVEDGEDDDDEESWRPSAEKNPCRSPSSAARMPASRP